MKKFSINVDMGAKNNGVFLASVEDANANSAKITNKSAFNIKIDKGDNFVLDRANRLAKRHTRRSFDRDCFVLRFAVCLGKQFKRFVMLSQQTCITGTAVHGQTFEYGPNWQKVMPQN